MPLYSDISGTGTGKCTDCTKLRQTLAFVLNESSSIRKCKGLLQDTVLMEPVPATSRVHERIGNPCTPEPRDKSGRTVRTETEREPVAMEASCECVGHPCTPEPRDASGRTDVADRD
ncbi:unnamed protein product [Boreogadus saida]